MKAPDFTLKDLEYALAVSRYLSFSRAAEACLISQPALSKQISNLEKSLGVALFERSKRQVLVTDIGEKLLAHARQVLEEAQALQSLASQPGLPLTGVFKLGVIASSGPYLLPYFIGALQKAYPDLKLVITEGLTENLIRELRQGSLDAVIAAPTFEEDGLASFPLFFEPFLLAASRNDYPNLRDVLSLYEVDTGQLILLADGHCLKDQTTALCAIPEAEASRQYRATSLETLLHMTAGGVGISIIPILARPDNSRLAKQLAFSQFSDGGLGRDMALFFRKQTPYRDSMQLLAGLIRSHLPPTVTPRFGVG